MATPIERPDLFLVARLLENLARAPQGMKRTNLQLACRINYTQLERYLDYLAARRFVALRADDNGGMVVAITLEGTTALLALARAIRDVLREEFAPGRPSEGDG